MSKIDREALMRRVLQSIPVTGRESAEYVLQVLDLIRSAPEADADKNLPDPSATVGGWGRAAKAVVVDELHDRVSRKASEEAEHGN